MPTVSLEAILFTLIVDSNKGHHIATFDFPGTYLHAEIPKDKRTLMKLREYFDDTMCNVNPEYVQDVRY